MPSEKELDELTQHAEDAMNGKWTYKQMATYRSRATPKKQAAEMALEAEELQMKIQDNTRQKSFNDQKRRLLTGRKAAHLAMKLRKERQ